VLSSREGSTDLPAAGCHASSWLCGWRAAGPLDLPETTASYYPCTALAGAMRRFLNLC
jgi:hypothetical protein